MNYDDDELLHNLQFWSDWCATNRAKDQLTNTVKKAHERITGLLAEGERQRDMMCRYRDVAEAVSPWRVWWSNKQLKRILARLQEIQP